jgi:hypothetical protein
MSSRDANPAVQPGMACADATSRVLPLLDGAAGPADPDAAPERIVVPAWLAADASWVIKVGDAARRTELRRGDLALIRRGVASGGQVLALARHGRVEFDVEPDRGALLGTVIAVVRRLEGDG